MIEEQFVSFDTAKMLKEAGFDVPTSTNYSNSGEVWQSSAPEDHNDDKSCKACSRPTQDLAARWLREVHEIHVFAFYQYNSKAWFGYIQDLSKGTAEDGMILFDRYYKSYEEAMEDTISEAIKLIKK